MSTDRINTALDTISVKPLTNPSQANSSEADYGSEEGGFRDLLSDSLGEGRERRPERKADRDSRSTTPTASEPARSTREPVSDRLQLDDRRISETRTDERQSVESRVEEGAPPAEFVASRLATETPTRTADEAVETTTITVQVEQSLLDLDVGEFEASLPTGTAVENTPPLGLVNAFTTLAGVPQLEEGGEGFSESQQTAASAEILSITSQTDGSGVSAEQEAVPEAETGDSNPTAIEQTGDLSSDADELPATIPFPSQNSKSQETDPENATKASAQSATPQQADASLTQVGQQVIDGDSTTKGGQSEQTKSAQDSFVSSDTKPTTNQAPEASATTVAGSLQVDPETLSNAVQEESAASELTVSKEAIGGATETEEKGTGSTEDGEQGDSQFSENRSETENSQLTASGLQREEPSIAVETTESVESPEISVAPPTTEPRGTAVTATVATSETAVVDVNQAGFVDRISQAVQTSADNRQQVTLRLTPPELGTLQIEVVSENGTVSARIDAQTAGARKLLHENLPQLREALAQNGTQVERIEVFLADNSSDSRGGQMGQGLMGQGEQGNASQDESALNGYDADFREAEENVDDQPENVSAQVSKRGTKALDITI